jgi:hypothetical protein
MKKWLFGWLNIIILIVSIITAFDSSPVKAEIEDIWWDDSWPYRVAVEVEGTGSVGINLDFSSLFSNLGLVGGILDLQSIRVVPYTSGVAGDPIPYQETYSVQMMDGEVLNRDPTGSEPYWLEGEQTFLSLDSERFSQGSSSIKSFVSIQHDLSSEVSFSYKFNNSEYKDWSEYESLIYHIWPEVNENAIDQTPDLFRMEISGLVGCPSRKIGGPALSMDQWNTTSQTLQPFGSCVTPDYSALIGLRFVFNVDQFEFDTGNFEVGDQVTFWLDDFRLVDQNGTGEIQWIAENGIDRYYIYFDTLNHTGHPEPNLTTLDSVQSGMSISGEVESGGYFHQVSGANTTNLSIWRAPIEEKILRDQTAPITHKPLTVYTARGEFEPFQLVIRSETEANLEVNVSDLVSSTHTISANQIDIFRVDYLELTQLSDFYGRLTDWPDPLYPILAGTEVNFPAGENQPLWFRVKITSSTSPGDYSGLITIGTATIPFTLKVWDIYFPTSVILPTEVGFDWETVLEAYGGTINGVPQICIDKLSGAITSTLADYYLTPLPDGAAPDGIIYSVTEYEVEEAHHTQTQTREQVWWSFSGFDIPPIPNPVIIDRTGIAPRILPWLAWIDRVDGFFFNQLVDWDSDPWLNPYSNDIANGDSFLFYPPIDSTLGFDPCDPSSNRLIPSIRLELFREGLEDYAYLKLLNGKEPVIGEVNDSDLWAETLIGSRTAFLRPPNKLESLRLDIADLLQSRQNKVFLPFLIH